MKDVQSLLRDYLARPDIMQLATVRDGQPWACTVHFYADDNLHLYWLSTLERRHSQEIKDDPRVALAFAIESARGQDPIGVQIEGDAELVEDPEEIKRVLPLYVKKLDREPGLVDDVISGANPHKLYHITPRLFVVFDKASFPDEPRQEWRP